MPVLAAGHICEKVCKPFGTTPPIFPRQVDWYRQNRAFDISRAKRCRVGWGSTGLAVGVGFRPFPLILTKKNRERPGHARRTPGGSPVRGRRGEHE
jgi:hypothetical protein